MTWFKVDDNFTTHRKVDDLGPDQAIAVAAWALCGSACMRDLTDGRVTEAAMRRTLALWSPRDRERAAAALVRVGLWHPHQDGGWEFHAWLDHQPSREQVERERVLAKDRQKRAREKKLAVTHAEVTRDDPRESRRDVAVSHAAPTRPDPTRPSEDQHTGSDTGRVRAVWDAWRSAFGRVPDVGSAEKLERVMGDPYADATREERRSVERLRALLGQCPPGADLGAWLSAAIEAWRADRWAAERGWPWAAFVAKAGELASRPPPQKPNHAPDDFGALESIESRFGDEVLP